MRRRADRMLWGSDWPHPSYEGPAIDDAKLPGLLRIWAADQQIWEGILVRNPARLYGFASQKRRKRRGKPAEQKAVSQRALEPRRRSARRARAAKRMVIKLGIDLHARPPHEHAPAGRPRRRSKRQPTATSSCRCSQTTSSATTSHMFSNLRSGAMQMMGIGDNILAELVPCRSDRQSRLCFQGLRDGLGRPGRRSWRAVSPEIDKFGLHVDGQSLGHGVPGDHDQHEADQ